MTSLIEQRSLTVREECLDLVLRALKSKYENQTQVAIAVNSSQPVISQFKNRKPVETATFIAICDKLNLKWAGLFHSNRTTDMVLRYSI